jgi:IstB-like ATP binding protein
LPGLHINDRQMRRRNLELEAAISKLDKYQLPSLDDIAYVTKDQAETSVPFELIAARCERRSLPITANQPFSEWGKIFTDKTMTLAAIDRRAPRHDPGDERCELSPQGGAQAQAWQRRLTVMAARPQ